MKPAYRRFNELDAVKEHAIHIEKLQKIKSRVDNKPPREMKHLQSNSKKELNNLKAQAEIQYRNQVLLKKLKKIGKEKKGKETAKVGGSFMGKSKIGQLERIGAENQKILNRIQSAKSYYSADKQKMDYLTYQYLKSQLSENAGRVPKTLTFCGEPENRSGKTTRPSTAPRVIRRSSSKQAI